MYRYNRVLEFERHENVLLIFVRVIWLHVQIYLLKINICKIILHMGAEYTYTHVLLAVYKSLS